MGPSSAARGWAVSEAQATTVVHRLAGLLPGSRRTPAGGVALAAGLVAPGTHPGWTDPVDDPVLGRVLARAAAAGVPLPAARTLRDLWPDLTATERRTVDRPLGDGRPGPLRIGGAPVRQADGTTCGSTVLAMLAAAGDPALALWLATGRLLPGHGPPELRTVPGASLLSPDAGHRLAALQRSVKRASTRRALGPLPWPAALGTPPWGAARTARFAGLAWTHVLVDDTDAGLVDAVLDRADTALAAGVPVPVYTGGDLRGGLAAAVPRHVVLLVPAHAPGYAVLEPGRGVVHRVDRTVLARPRGPHPALGGWSHVCWAVLPRTAA